MAYNFENLKDEVSSDNCNCKENLEIEEDNYFIEENYEKYEKLEKHKKKDKIKNKQNFKQKKSHIVLNIVEKSDYKKNNRIIISLLKDNAKSSKTKSFIRFDFNLLTDTCEGIVSELQTEIGLTKEESVDLNKDFNSLSKF